MNFTTVLSEAVESVEAAPELFFEPIHFLENLKNMGIGMLVIFVIIGIIILTTIMINKAFAE